MTETIITVQGTNAERYPAEQVDVQLSVSFDGPERTKVFDSTSASAEMLRITINGLVDKQIGPVTHWSSDSVHVWGARPWNSDGKQLAVVYHSTITFTARFRDFDALAKFVEQCATTDGVIVGALKWSLTDTHTRQVTDNVRSNAVADAVAKATLYAKAIGLRSVTAVAIADPGMLGDGSRPGAEFGMERASFAMKAMDASGGPELSLKPEDIEVSATVDARFVAS